MNRSAKTALSLFLVASVSLVPIGPSNAEEPKTDAESGSEFDVPNLSVGVSAGFVDRFGKTVHVDAASGATASSHEKTFNEPGAGVSVGADAGLIRLGKGDLGLGLGFFASFPSVYFDLGLIPRYRLHLATRRAKITGVEPWLGFPMFLSFEDRFSKDLFFSIGGSLGCDLALGERGFLLGLTIHATMVNPVPVRHTMEIQHEPYTQETRTDSVFALIHFGYRIR